MFSLIKVKSIFVACFVFSLKEILLQAAGSLDDHAVTILADSFLPLDENSIPTGM